MAVLLPEAEGLLRSLLQHLGTTTVITEHDVRAPYLIDREISHAQSGPISVSQVLGSGPYPMVV